MSEWLCTVLAEGVVVLWLRRVRGCACRRQPAALVAHHVELAWPREEELRALLAVLCSVLLFV